MGLLVVSRLAPRLSLYALLFACSLGLPSESRADLVTIDFEDAGPCSNLCGLVVKPGEFFEDGFHIKAVMGHYDLLGTSEDQSIQIDTYGGSHSVVRIASLGGSFDFLDADILNWSPNPEGLPLDEFAFFASSAGGYAEITEAGKLHVAGSQWRNLMWVEFGVRDPNRDTQQDGLRFDNVRVRVPEPATVILVGLGAGLVLVRRRIPRER